MMTDTEVLKELKVFRRMMKHERPYGFLRWCKVFGIVHHTGWVAAALNGKASKVKENAREFFIADLLED